MNHLTSNLDACLGNNLDDLIDINKLLFISLKALKYRLHPAWLPDHHVTTEITIRSWGKNRTGFHLVGVASGNDGWVSANIQAKFSL